MSDSLSAMADGVTNETLVADVSESTASRTLSIGIGGTGEEDELPGIGHECSICLQSCIHPVQLPCSHIFCFLCIKGVANHSKKCALCRSEIPSDFLLRPLLLNVSEVLQTPSFDGKYQWFYEGGRGWWQYDIRASAEIEDRYQKGEQVFEMLIAGFLYVVDIENMIQYRRNTPSRRRRIKRDLADIPDKKGVAGLSYRLCPPKRMGGDGGEGATNQGPTPNQPLLPSSSSSTTSAASALHNAIADAPAVDSVQHQLTGLSLSSCATSLAHDGESAQSLAINGGQSMQQQQQHLHLTQQGTDASCNRADAAVIQSDTGGHLGLNVDQLQSTTTGRRSSPVDDSLAIVNQQSRGSISRPAVQTGGHRSQTSANGNLSSASRSAARIGDGATDAGAPLNRSQRSSRAVVQSNRLETDGSEDAE